MATVASLSIGGDRDVTSIRSPLVVREKQPLTKLPSEVSTVQTRVSAYGRIKSLVSTFSDAATGLASLSTFNAVTMTSNAATVSVTSIGATGPKSLSVKVESLAKAQSTASGALLPVGGALGVGTLRLQLGRWTIVPSSFTPQPGGVSVDIEVSASDTLNDVASKISDSHAGVHASVLADVSGERLLLQSKSTGVEAGFALSIVNDANGNAADAAGLSRLVSGSSIQYAEDARGESDKSVLRISVNDFVLAYNEINQAVNALTQHNPSSKRPDLLLGDSTAVGLQNALRGILQSSTSGSVYQRLNDVGITQQPGGDLAVDRAKLDAAINNGDELKNLLGIDNGNPMTNGVASKFMAFANGLLAIDGVFSSNEASPKRLLETSSREQTGLNGKLARVEAQLNRRYSPPDVRLSSLNALNGYITQQVAQWNKLAG